MSKSLLGGGAATAVAFFSASLIFYNPQTSVAETLATTFWAQEFQQQRPDAARNDAATETASLPSDPAPAARPSGASGASPDALTAQRFQATAYSLRGRTASGRSVARGIIAADRRVLPLGTRVRLEAGGYSGEYLVADTGGLVKGRKIDIWVPSSAEAMRFGRRTVKLTVLSYGGRRAAPRPAIKVR